MRRCEPRSARVARVCVCPARFTLDGAPPRPRARQVEHFRGSSSPYATRLARVAVKSGYLCIPNKKWQRRFFVLKPTTMLYYFSSNMDEEPLGCIDVEAFSAVECCDVGADGRVTLELSRPGEGSEAARFMLQAETEEEGMAWIESLRNESYTRLRMERDSLRTQTNEFVTEIQQLEEQVRTLQRTESEAVQVRQRHSKLVASLASLNRELVSIAPEPVDTEASSADGTGAVARRAPPADADQQLFNEDDSSGFGAEQRPKSAALIERQQEQRLVDDLRRQCRALHRQLNVLSARLHTMSTAHEQAADEHQQRCDALAERTASLAEHCLELEKQNTRLKGRAAKLKQQRRALASEVEQSRAALPPEQLASSAGARDACIESGDARNTLGAAAPDECDDANDDARDDADEDARDAGCTVSERPPADALSTTLEGCGDELYDSCRFRQELAQAILAQMHCAAPDPLRDGGTSGAAAKSARPHRQGAAPVAGPKSPERGDAAVRAPTAPQDAPTAEGSAAAKAKVGLFDVLSGDTLDKLKGHLLDGFAARTHAPPQLLISHSDTVDPLFAEPARDDADSTDQAPSQPVGPPPNHMPEADDGADSTDESGVNLPESLSEPIVLGENEFDIAFTEQKLGLTFEVVQNSLHISGFKATVRALQPRLKLGARLVAIDGRRVDGEPAQKAVAALRRTERPIVLVFSTSEGDDDGGDEQGYSKELDDPALGGGVVDDASRVPDPPK